jgi:hypothetical protein
METGRLLMKEFVKRLNNQKNNDSSNILWSDQQEFILLKIDSTGVQSFSDPEVLETLAEFET